MTTVSDLANFLEEFAPSTLAESWDNVGLLTGDPSRPAKKIMTCLTVTPDSAQEAIDERADLIITHHPIPFKPLKKLTTETISGRLLWDLIRHEIAIYSPHTAFDSAKRGINQGLAEALELSSIQPLITHSDQLDLGSGRFGILENPITLMELAQKLKTFLAIDSLHVVGQKDSTLSSIAVACGAAGTFLDAAQKNKCDCLILGETNFHTCLEAEANGMALLLTGHYASERFAVEALVKILETEFSDLTIWASQREHDPVSWI